MNTTVTDSDGAGGGRVQAVLRESGIGDSPRLLAALTAFTEDVPPVPAPSPELAALITGGVVIPLAPARFRPRILPAALVAAALALGGGAAAAASPDVRHAVEEVIEAITGATRPGPEVRKPSAPSETPVEPGLTDPDRAPAPGGSPAPSGTVVPGDTAGSVDLPEGAGADSPVGGDVPAGREDSTGVSGGYSDGGGSGEKPAQGVQGPGDAPFEGTLEPVTPVPGPGSGSVSGSAAPQDTGAADTAGRGGNEGTEGPAAGP
ncbi:hypothetical protein ACFFGR_14765 [Arthrobacter liuii]|uniref:Uncharacterized protein n=1 Tax=Arthrobacter liuii TaxID=1476996 RepID=A0ABQ2AY91_9MICC|nr:hypothetical protein [Arthrobacter liuii]GGH99271.1 hypothetical protein GCM10007170_33720 [Arthrobacter liuii]